MSTTLADIKGITADDVDQLTHTLFAISDYVSPHGVDPTPLCEMFYRQFIEHARVDLVGAVAVTMETYDRFRAIAAPVPRPFVAVNDNEEGAR